MGGTCVTSEGEKLMQGFVQIRGERNDLEDLGVDGTIISP